MKEAEYTKVDEVMSKAREFRKLARKRGDHEKKLRLTGAGALVSQRRSEEAAEKLGQLWSEYIEKPLGRGQPLLQKRPPLIKAISFPFASGNTIKPKFFRMSA